MRLENKVAIITGAAKGIGGEMAKLFAAEGAKVIAADMSPLSYDCGNVEFYPLNVADGEACRTLAEYAREKYGKVDILVNNAGITRDAMFHKMTDQQARMVLDVNFYGTFYCCQAVIAGMREREYGKIINISSTSAFGNIGQTNYAASKAAIDGFTRTLALESARKNITVNSIAPGMIETDILKTIPEDIMKQKIANVPANRLGQPSEIASVASFLASDDSSWVTGNTILACGGLKMRG